MIVALVIIVTIILALIWFYILNENERQEIKRIAIHGINDTFGASEQRNKTYIITTATIFTCNANNQTDCKVLASESVKRELKKLPNEKLLAV